MNYEFMTNNELEFAWLDLPGQWTESDLVVSSPAALPLPSGAIPRRALIGEPAQSERDRWCQQVG